MNADPLSDILSLTEARSLLSASLAASGDWAVRFGPEAFKFIAVTDGACYLCRDGAPPLPLQADDCFLLAHCDEHVLCSDPARLPVQAHDIFHASTHAVIGHADGSPATRLIGGKIHVDHHDAGLLLAELPTVLHVAGQRQEAAGIRWLLTRLAQEWQTPAPGGAMAADHLAQLLLLEALRVWLDSAPAAPDAPARTTAPGWLRATRDRQIGAALRLMHGDPRHAWQLGELAAATGMSRSNFALRFKDLVGVAPIDYLMRWRMRLGAKALRASQMPIARIAADVGYQSESAFSTAFRKTMGIPPHRYRMQRAGASDAGALQR